MSYAFTTKQGVTFSGIEPPATEAQIKQLDDAFARVGQRLPDDYREFLVLAPAAIPDRASFVFGEGLRSTVYGFDGLSALLFYAEGRTPSDTRLAIAGSSRGPLSLGITPGPDFGKVWIHRRGKLPIELVADSFDAFLRKCEKAPHSSPRKAVTEQGVELTIENRSTTEEAVAALEQQIGSRLPEDYRQFMLRYNGGTPKPATFHFVEKPWGENTTDAVEAFLSLGDPEYHGLEDCMDTYTDRIPRGTLPIAEDGCGNLVLLGVAGSDDAGLPVRGKVFYWFHELEPQDPLDWSNVSPVADSFDEFLRGLKASSSAVSPSTKKL